MKIALYGGSFDPPHLGHVEAAKIVMEELRPDRFFLIPANISPFKQEQEDAPTAEERMALCRLAFAELPGLEISDAEIRRGGKSYTADTVALIREQYPDAELLLVVGTDLVLEFEHWYQYEYLLEQCTLAVLEREDYDPYVLREKLEALKREHGARVHLLSRSPQPMSSTDIRERLPLRLRAGLLDDRVYSEVIRHGWYGALPELSWLREKAYAMLEPKRIAHVVGCESEAVMLAKTWGEDPDAAATAGILHDITKRCRGEAQLELCRQYGIEPDESQLRSPDVLHALTAAELARERFHIDDEIYGAIRWHTTGKPDMTRLERIVYLADFIEPTRDFPGLDELRRLAYRDLNAAMALALSLSLGNLRRKGREIVPDTLEEHED